MGAPSGVVIVAGPSGSGKSHLAERLGWPILRLDDFYRDVDASNMPRSTLGIIDWDHPGSWDAVAAVGAIAELCASGTAEVPVYDIATSRRTGTQILSAPDGRFIAEGLFAPVIVDACREAGLLRAAICLYRPASVTFALRLFRDLREARKPPSMLVRRGWRLMKDEPRIVAEAVAHGCEAMSPREARRLLGS
ncbi:uridine kinase family protein [Aeromicrobium wangtongii]|uniref:uridine kinase family protein n=1 Tax=Aeromicrobium wangtongii TaxID=2969247 RepID=UPI002017F189|nr:ATP-binding protein [Aeromicrobium wangtongii]MCL3819864.1 ATP-binding protein [Aeromicrobium wangtongii]